MDGKVGGPLTDQEVQDKAYQILADLTIVTLLEDRLRVGNVVLEMIEADIHHRGKKRPRAVE